jgi:hypothetical protein
MNHCTKTNEVWYSKRLCTYLQVPFESLFCLMNLLNMENMKNCDIMLGQTLNHSV